MYNRYSYVRNNPLNATDPSGYFLDLIDGLIFSYIDSQLSKPVFNELAKNPALATAVQIVGSAVSAYYCGACSIGFNAQFSKNMAYAQSDDFAKAMEAAAISGISSAAFYGVGSLHLEGAANIVAHGVVGGVMAELQGGSFGHGFAAAGFSAYASSKGWTGPEGIGPTVDGVVVSAVVGGTASVISGGKFANGAVTGAFSYVLNSSLHADAPETPQERVNRLAEEVYKDFPELRRANLIAVEDISGLFHENDGQYMGGSDILIKYKSSSDDWIKSTIFHELLHMDEALTVANGSKWGYAAYEFYTHKGHDPWINSADMQYNSYLYNPRAVKPDLSSAPWRSQE
ncbi:hypothetical protein [Microbulbifer sp. TRSA005]